MKYYLLAILQDVEPELRGPFKTAGARDRAAKAHRHTDPSMRDGLYRLSVDKRGNAHVCAFSGGELGYD